AARARGHPRQLDGARGRRADDPDTPRHPHAAGDGARNRGMTRTATRGAGLCGLLAFVTFNAGWIVGDLVQRPAFSPADDDISYLGALTAKSPWLYNQ